jgi:CHAT domain-containing protein/Flp pilus assembly protein TadD
MEVLQSWQKRNQALQVKPGYHEAWHGRGIALKKLGRLDEALASYDKALEIKPNYYEAWNDRGALLFSGGHYEEAISSYNNALKIEPNYHQAWSNQANVLNKLGHHEEALCSYDKALEIKPNSHEALYNKGMALCNLGCYEEAISSYDNALQIKPDSPQAWHNRGIALRNLGRFELAIASYDKALGIKPDSHETWISRGNAAGRSVSCEQLLALGSAITWNNSALNQRRYEGALASLKEGFKYVHQNSHPEGWGLLHQAIGNAHYFQGKGKRNYREYWRKAVDEYRQALITLTTEEAYRELHLEVVRDWIRVLFGLGKDAVAKQGRQHGLEVFRQLLNSQKTPFQRRQLEVKFLSFSQMRVDVLVEDGDLVPALEAAERNKNLYLTWILDAQKEHILSLSYEEIQQLVTNSTTAIVYWHLSPHALTTFIIKHGAEEPIVISSPPFSRGVGGDLRHHDKPNQSLKRLRDFETWLNKWNKQYQDYRSRKEKVDPPQPPLKRGEKESDRSWCDNLPELLEQLGDILNIPAILSTLTDIKQLILIPHRDLHRFPFHALFPNTFTITYLPSAQIGINLVGQNTVGATTPGLPPNVNGAGRGVLPLLSVEHPNSEGFELLPYAEIESTAIAKLFSIPDEDRFSGQAATKTEVKDALVGGYSIFHFTGHGTYNFDRPKQSALYLSGKDYLTLEEICSINLSGYQLVSLAACETALTGNQTITEDYVGLVSAFVYQRVTYVVSTLWTVPDLASSLLMIYFYWQLKKGKSPTVALAKATKWLRNLTHRKLERFYKVISTKLPKEEKPLRPHVRNELYQIHKMEPSHKKEKPFDHPYYWAAFTITGGERLGEKK